MLSTFNQKLLSQPIAEATAKFLAIKDNSRNLKTAYNQLQTLAWDAVRQNPSDKNLYELLVQLEYEYSWTRKEKLQLEAKQHRDSQIRKIWEFSLGYNPDWAESRYYLGDLEADAGRCEEARRYFLEGIEYGSDIDYIEKCFDKFLSLSPLSAAALIYGTLYPKCDLYENTFQMAQEQMEADWIVLRTLQPKLQNTQSLDIQDTLSLINTHVGRSHNAWAVLQELLSEQQKHSFTYQHLKKVIWPYTDIVGKPYAPHEFASLLGLEKDFEEVSLLEQLKWDYALQKIFLLVDAPSDVLKADQSTWNWVTTPYKKQLAQLRFSLSEFDETVKLLFVQQAEQRVNIDVALTEYDRLWSIYKDEEERLEAIHDIELDYEGYGKEAWIELAGAARNQLWIGLNMLDFAQFLPVYVTDLVRRIVEQQPWLGRYLAQQEKLRAWLHDKILLSSFKRDTRYQEIDRYLHNLQTGNWKGVADIIQLFARNLENCINPENQLLKQLMPAILGNQVWNWLDQDSQLFLNNAEHQHILEILSNNNPGSPEKDYIGFYLLYHKAFEVALQRVIGEYVEAKIKKLGKKRWPQFKDYLDCLKNFRNEKSGLPDQCYFWTDELAKRGQEVKTPRNAATHEKPLRYEQYAEARHHLLGVSYRNRRKVSVFWLAYALDTILNGKR